MNIFTSIAENAKSLLKRFPLFLSLSFLTGVSIVLYWIFGQFLSYEAEFFAASLNYTLAMATVVSIPLTLCLEKLCAKKSWSYKKASIIGTFVTAAASVLYFFSAHGREDNDYFYLTFWSLILCYFFIAGFIVASVLKEKTGAGIIIALTASFGLWFCVSASCSLIFAAFFNLIINNDEILEAMVPSSWTATAFFVALPFFVSNATKKSEDISIPKAYKIIFLYAIFPLFIVLIAVLYAYIIKSLCMMNLPSGTFNPFVSSATLGFLVLSFVLKVFDNKATKILRKAGSFVMIPLVVVQIVAFCIRENAYGLTQVRYASLLYIFFSIAAIVILFLSNRRPEKNLERLLFGIFAGLCLVACLPGVNLIDVSEASMIRVIENIYKKHNMYTPEKLITENAAGEFTDEEKVSVTTAFNNIQVHRDSIAWVVKVPEKEIVIYNGSASDKEIAQTLSDTEKSEPKMKVSFINTFGFEKQWHYNKTIEQFKDGLKIEGSNDFFICKGYNKAESFYISSYNAGKIIIENKKSIGAVDITEDLKKAFAGAVMHYGNAPTHTKNLEIVKGNSKIVITDGYVYLLEDGKLRYTLNGWILSK